mgnify:CR=1 FL=1
MSNTCYMLHILAFTHIFLSFQMLHEILTLLDSETNRSYGNSLFCTKRRIIIDRIKQGVFVPVATQYIFSKFYDEKGTNRSVWAKEDMEAYQKYIVKMLSEYLPENN